MARTLIHERSIADDAVTTSKIKDDAVTTAKILDANVTTAKVADLAITSDKLGADSVIAGKIAAGAISQSADFAAGVVDATALGSDAVITAKVQDAAITTAKVADDAITPDKLQDTAVTLGSYGAADKSLAATVDAQGRLTALSEASISIVHTQVSDFDAGVVTNRLDEMAAPTAAVAMNSQQLTGLADGTADDHGVSKLQMENADAATLASAQSYADGLVQGIDTIFEVKYRADGNLDLTQNSPASMDGQSPSAGELFLAGDQTDPAENGIYKWNSGAVPTRDADFDSLTEIEAKPFVFVALGTKFGNTGWMLASDMTGKVIGTDPIVFKQFSGAGQTEAGDGITRSGNVLAFEPKGSGGLAVDSNGGYIDTAGVTNAMLANSTVSFGGIQLSLGGTDATPAFDLVDATNYPFASLTGQAQTAQIADLAVTDAKINDGAVDAYHLNANVKAQLGPDMIGHYVAAGTKSYVDFDGVEGDDLGSYSALDLSEWQMWVYRDGLLQRHGAGNDFTYADNGSGKLRVTLEDDLVAGEYLSVRLRSTANDS